MWKEELDRILQLLGHRNWILVVDKAYPLQSARGIDTFDTGRPLPEVLNHTLKRIAKAPHLRPVVYLDLELEYMTDRLAAGVEDLRQQLARTISHIPDEGKRVIPHDEIFERLEAASAMFRVVVLKTESLVPYTSVFIELDCGYWNPASERELRAGIEGK